LHNLNATIPNPAIGDEWFNTDLSGGGKWEKFTGTDWKRTGRGSESCIFFHPNSEKY